MSCLPDAINSLDQSGLSPFTESIILATLFRQVIAHRQQSATNDIRSNNLQDFWNRHNQLVEMLKSRADALTHNYATSRQYSCPMLLFTSMLAQAIVIFLCNILESVHCETDESYNTVAAFRHRSLSAARGIFNLSRSIAPLSFLKVSRKSCLALCLTFGYILLIMRLGASFYTTSPRHLCGLL